MATHSTVLAWRIPGTGEPGGLPSMGSHRVRHDWSDLAAAADKEQCCYRLKLTALNILCLWPAPFLQISNQVISATTRMGSEFFHVELALFVNWTGRVTKKLVFLRIGQPPKYSTSIFPREGLPRWLSSKEANCQGRRCRRLEFDLWVGKIPWKRKCNPLQYSCLRNSKDRGAWGAIVHEVAKRETRLSDWARSHSIL